jgi:hypothetical protein
LSTFFKNDKRSGVISKVLSINFEGTTTEL